MALKLEGQIVEVVDAHAGRMHAARKHILLVGRVLDAVARRRERKVLDELDVFCVICVSAEALAALFGHPRRQGFAGGDVVHLDAICLLHFEHHAGVAGLSVSVLGLRLPWWPGGSEVLNSASVLQHVGWLLLSKGRAQGPVAFALQPSAHMCTPHARASTSYLLRCDATKPHTWR